MRERGSGGREVRRRGDEREREWGKGGERTLPRYIYGNRYLQLVQALKLGA